MRESFPAELSSDTKQRLARALDCDCWAEIPDVVQNNLRVPDADLEGFLERHERDGE
jgi:hypothetical protein